MTENNWLSRRSKDQAKAILLEQFEAFWQRDTGTVRSRLAAIEGAASLPHAVVVSGLRRVGKSTLLAQMAHRLGKEAFYYANFEDDRFLGFQAEDAADLHTLLIETFGERKIFIIDEVQNVQGWEHFVRRLMDMGMKFYLTGSNAALLSGELGSRLTGRHLPVELFPFSFGEYLRFRNEPAPDLDRLTTAGQALLNKALGDYLRCGGIPDALKYPEFPLLRTLYDDVLHRDIATRYRIGAMAALKELASTLMSQPACRISFNKLKGQLRLGSVNTVKTFVDYMANSWLVFTLNLYDFSVKRQQIAPKKTYCIDTGLANAVGFSFSPNTGRLLENLVFLALRRQSKDLYYVMTRGGHEVDFFLPEHGQLVQVAGQLDSQATRDREVRALEAAMMEVPVKSAIILSDANGNDMNVRGVPVAIRSTAEWLLRQEGAS